MIFLKEDDLKDTLQSFLGQRIRSTSFDDIFFSR